MQNTNTILAVQSTSVTNAKQLEQYNIATHELFIGYDYQDIKPNIDKMLLGWVSSEFLDQTNCNERLKVYSFFLELCNHIGNTGIQITQSKENTIGIENYFLFTAYSQKQVNHFFDEVMYNYLCTEIANDNATRCDVVYYSYSIRKYLNEIFKLKKKFKTQLEPLQ